MNENIIKINVIKTNVGVFIKEECQPYCSNSIEKLFFDGKEPERTFCEWLKIDKIPKKITRLTCSGGENYRFELIDKKLKSKVFPLVYAAEQVAEKDDYGDYRWIPEHSMKQSLYELKWDDVPPKHVDVKFELKVLCELDKIDEYVDFTYNIQKSKWPSEGVIPIQKSAIKHQIIDKILFPSILLPLKPCKLSSLDSYKIIRQHVIENINPTIAEITSNYDFCFTVKKIIELCTPEEYRADVSRFGARKPRYETRYRRYRQVEIFEMTSEEEKYKEYTPIKGFSGNSHKELKNNIDKFLSELMTKINEPLKDCPHCKGMGVIIF